MFNKPITQLQRPQSTLSKFVNHVENIYAQVWKDSIHNWNNCNGPLSHIRVMQQILSFLFHLFFSLSFSIRSPSFIFVECICLNVWVRVAEILKRRKERENERESEIVWEYEREQECKWESERESERVSEDDEQTGWWESSTKKSALQFVC